MAELRWYAARLRAMSPAEMAYRAWQAWMHRWDRLAGLGRTPFSAAGATVATRLGLLGGRGPDRVRAMPPAAWRRVESYARRILAGEVRVLGQYRRVGLPPRWHIDPVSGREWPLQPSSTVDVRRGGVKFVWELSRHEFVVPLAAAFARTGEADWAEAAAGVLDDWIAHNPPLMGVHWTSGLEMGIRLVHWGLVADLLAGSPAWTVARRTRVMGAAAWQARYLRRHLSAYSSANNHLLGELMGLAAFDLGFAADATKGASDAARRFWEELVRQTTADGVLREQTFHYQSFVLQMAAWVAAAQQVRGQAVPAAAADRLRRCAEVLVQVTGSDDEVAAVGDADDGAVGCLDDERVAGETADWIAAVTHGRRPRDETRAPTAWLLGTLATPASLNAGAAADGDWHWGEGGYAGVRRGRRWLMMDAGPLGFLSIAAHGHADALAVWLRDGRDHVWEDSGTFTYHENWNWRRYFRGVWSHNTLVVDGQDQSQQTGPTMWGRKARAGFLAVVRVGEANLLAGEHDGYTALADPCVHRRVVLARPEGILVVDLLRAAQSHAVEQRWHLGSGVAEVIAGRLTWRGTAGAVWHARSSLADLRLILADERSPTAWRSRHYGERHPGLMLNCVGELGGPAAVCATWWWPGAADEWHAVAVRDQSLELSGSAGRLIIDVPARDGVVAVRGVVKGRPIPAWDVILPGPCNYS